MAVLGDRVQVPSKKVGQVPREGVVVGVSGALLTVRWSTGEESTLMPSMGSLLVVGKSRGRTAPPARSTKTPSKKVAAPPAKRSTKSSATSVKSAKHSSSAGKRGGAKKPSSKGSTRKPKKGK